MAAQTRLSRSTGNRTRNYIRLSPPAHPTTHARCANI